VRDEGLRGPRTGAEIDEIAVITPLKAMTNPRIPIGVTCEIKPANRVIRPKSRSPAPAITRFRDGEMGAFDESAETRRGSSVKRAASISSKRRFSRSDKGITPQ
jgi:hypothetical protein